MDWLHRLGIEDRYVKWKGVIAPHLNIVFFVGGFVFDSLTLNRIDSALDLVIQAGYLLSITGVLILNARVERGLWTPQGRMAKLWSYESEIIHFFYGGLLSAYVIFYFKSTAFSRSAFFFALIFLIFFANEMPQIRKAGTFARLGLYAFCVASFLNYLIPVLVGRMGPWIFALGWVLSALLVGAVIYALSALHPNSRQTAQKLSWAPSAVLLLMAVFYFNHWIPPVPLSLKYAGVFRQVEARNGEFTLTYRRPHWTRFWLRDERHFLARPGDRVYCFVRVFAPRRFTHRVALRWHLKDKRGRWQAVDRIMMDIFGGRGDGFRGASYKENYVPGVWRVDVETEDGRVLGGIKFTIRDDPASDPFETIQRRM